MTALKPYQNKLGRMNQLLRLIWGMVWAILFRPTPRPFHGWRIALLRIFGAKIGKRCAVYPSCRIWAPWNLEMHDFACLSADVDCYSVDKITLGRHVTVSQGAFLCTASHDISDPGMRLTTAPISLGDNAWVTARAIIYPGVVLGEGAVVAAGSVAIKNVDAWTVVGGNPAKFIKMRVLQAARNE